MPLATNCSQTSPSRVNPGQANLCVALNAPRLLLNVGCGPEQDSGSRNRFVLHFPLLPFVPPGSALSEMSCILAVMGRRGRARCPTNPITLPAERTQAPARQPPPRPAPIFCSNRSPEGRVHLHKETFLCKRRGRESHTNQRGKEVQGNHGDEKQALLQHNPGRERAGE